MRPKLIDECRADAAYYYSLSGKDAPRMWMFATLLNASLCACFMFRVAARTSGFPHVLFRHLLLAKYGCEVGSGAKLGAPMHLPHPTGIVVGGGVVIGAQVHIFQGVTLGMDGSGRFPVVGDRVWIFPGAVVAGPLHVEDGSRVRALSLLTA